MALSAGSQLGPYKMVAPLGAGGMGEVYRARDARLERDVAIKVLPEHLASDAVALRHFEREAKALAALSHPNIVTIFDVGKVNSTAFVVMELLNGSTLRTLIKDSRLTWKKATEIAADVSEGLAAAHSKGIIHRDLKPENIFLTQEGRVKILDFGVARFKPDLAQAEFTEATTKSIETETGIIRGTLPYMSPEQARGITLDARSDIFSFGSLLYEMLSGHRAFDGKTGADVLSAILKDEPPPLEKNIPLELQDLIRHCLQKNPDQRVHSAHDLALILRQLLKVSDTYHYRKTVKLAVPKSRAAMWSLAVLIAVAMMIAAFSFLHHPKGIESLAVLPFASDGAEEYFSDGITESITRNLSQLSKLKVIASTSTLRYKGKPLNFPSIGKELGVRAVLVGKIVQRGQDLSISAELVDVENQQHLWGQHYQRQLSDIFALQEEIAKEVSKGLRLRLTSQEQERLTGTSTKHVEAYQHYLRGRYYWQRRTADGLRKAILEFQQAIDKDPNYALAYAGLAESYLLMEEHAGTPLNEMLPKAKNAATRALQIDDSLFEAHLAFGFIQMRTWQWEKGFQEYVRALQLNPNDAYARVLYGNALLSVRARLDDSLTQLKRAHELDPLSALTNTNLARVYLLKGNDKLAEDLCRKFIELDPTHYGPYLILAFVYQKQERNKEAITVAQKAVELSQRGQTALSVLGYCYARAGESSAAIAIARQLEERFARKEAHGIVIAWIYAGLGEPDQAFAWIEKDYQNRSGILNLYMKSFPPIYLLQRDPRYRQLLERMGIRQ